MPPRQGQSQFISPVSSLKAPWEEASSSVAEGSSGVTERGEDWGEGSGGGTKVGEGDEEGMFCFRD